jgi:hypothetical protein
MTSQQSPLFLSAMEIIETRKLWWSEWQGARDFVFAGQPSKALASLISDFDLDQKEAEVLVAWVSSSLNSPKVTLVEIAVADIPFIRSKVIDADKAPPENPYQVPTYIARRGVFIGAVSPFEVEEDDKVVRGVIFQDKEIEPEMLDQVWEVRAI